MANAKSSSTDKVWIVAGYALTALFFIGGFVLLVSLNHRSADDRRKIESTPAYQACLEEKSKKSSGGIDGVYYSWRCSDEGKLINEATTYEEARAEEEAGAPEYCDVNRCR